jgi:CarD family transcriptional regulator
MEFKVGDNAVYPSHGVGQVCAIETKNYGGIETTFYSIRILETGAKIMVPKNGLKASGLRPIINEDEAKEVFSILKKTDIKIDTQTWNRRYREYMEKIKTGSIFEIAEVLRDLFLLKLDKELSFGERKLLDQARTLLIKELSLSTTTEEQSVESEIKQIFGL